MNTVTVSVGSVAVSDRAVMHEASNIEANNLIVLNLFLFGDSCDCYYYRIVELMTPLPEICEPFVGGTR